MSNLLRVRVRICGEVIVDIWEADLLRFARLFPDLRLYTPSGDQYKVDPVTGKWHSHQILPIPNSPATDRIVSYRSVSGN
jgi:hypothetical protein